MNTIREAAGRISDDLLRELNRTPDASELDLDRLARAVEALDSDAGWRAEYLKALFIEQMLAAMNEEGVNQTELANRWGKTRQYVSKLLRESSRINVTIETMCQLAHLLGRHIEIQVLRRNEVGHVLHTVKNKNVPNVMPREVVQDVERRRAAARRTLEGRAGRHVLTVKLRRPALGK